MGNAKKIIVGTGILLVWTGGCIIAWKAGDVLGKTIGKGCVTATEKLLALI